MRSPPDNYSPFRQLREAPPLGFLDGEEKSLNREGGSLGGEEGSLPPESRSLGGA